MIVIQARASRYFSVIADGTIDTAKMDQLTLVIRYIFRGDIKEKFIKFTDATGRTTGKLYNSKL